ncbi:MAG: carbon-nitrogen hydrolase family protein [Candidatus Hydrogenedentes bacterium]|nr:carbon-nitrogen hydrolase family protein [Candidatus Hydrogenedentota bacterium]
MKSVSAFGPGTNALSRATANPKRAIRAADRGAANRSPRSRVFWLVLMLLATGICGAAGEMEKESIVIAQAQVALAAAEGAVQHPGLRVAMIQMDVIDGDLAENTRRAEKSIREAADQKADLVCLPEAADLGWLYQKARENAQPIPGAYTDLLSNLAKELNVWICGGCLEKDGEKTFNSAILIDRSGAIVLKHRKISTLPKLTAHLYDAGNSGDIKVVDTEFGRVGVTICADNFNIVHPQKVADQGAWLLITPHGFAEKQEDLLDNGVAFINHIKNVASKTKLWVVGTNTALSEVAGGDWKGYLHSGASTIADPAGKAKVIGRFLEPDLVIYDIPVATPPSE